MKTDAKSNICRLHKILYWLLIGDYFNIKAIFEYRYGPNVHFANYISKFYSNNIFHYNNSNETINLIKSICNPENKPNSLTSHFFARILIDFHEKDLISIRDIIQLQKACSVYETLNPVNEKNSKSSKYILNKFMYFHIIDVLERIMDIESILKKFETCSKFDFVREGYYNYEEAMAHAFPCLIRDVSFDYTNIPSTHVEFKSKNFNITLNYRGYDLRFFRIIELKIDNKNYPLKEFNVKDFYLILTEITANYIRIGGFK